MKLDYTALKSRATRADVDAYRIVYKDASFVVPKPLQVVGIILVVVAVAWIFIRIVTGYIEAVGHLILLIIAGLVVMAYVEADKKKTQRRAMVYKFALMNGANYVIDVSEPGYGGAIFNYGHSRSIVDAVIFPDGTEMGNYRYITGSGKNASEHHWGYVRIKLNRKLPHMLLDAKSNNTFGKFSNLPQSLGNQPLSLEGDFDKYFTLYVPKGYQRDALYILTPDVMAALIDAGKNYDIEIVDDELFIYGPALNLSLQSTIEPLLAVIDRIGTELRDQVRQYRDERVPAHTGDIVAEAGRRLKKRINPVSMLFTAVIVILMLYSIVSVNFPYFVSLFGG